MEILKESLKVTLFFEGDIYRYEPRRLCIVHEGIKMAKEKGATYRLGPELEVT